MVNFVKVDSMMNYPFRRLLVIWSRRDGRFFHPQVIHIFFYSHFIRAFLSDAEGLQIPLPKLLVNVVHITFLLLNIAVTAGGEKT